MQRSTPSLLLQHGDFAVPNQKTIANYNDGDKCAALNPDIEVLIPKLKALTCELSTIQTQLEEASYVCHKTDFPCNAMKVHEEIITYLKSLCQDYEQTFKGLENTIKSLVKQFTGDSTPAVKLPEIIGQLMGDLPTKVIEISRQLERTEAQMKTHEDIIVQLRRLCLDYEYTIKHLETMINELVNQPATGKENVLDITGEVAESLQSEVVKLKQQLEISQSKLQSAQKEIANQEEIMAAMTDIAEGHELKIKELEIQIHEHGEAKGSQKAVETDKKYSQQELLNKLEACENQKKLLEDNQNVIESKLENLQTQADSLSEENRVLQEQLSMSTALVSQLEDSVREWGECNEELKAAGTKQEMLLSNLGQEKQSLKNQLADCMSEMARCKSDLCSVTAERNKLRQQLLNCSYPAAEDQVDNVQLCTDEKSVDCERLASMTCIAASMEAELKSLRQTVIDQENQLKAVKDAAIEEVQLQRELEKARKSLAERESTISSLRDRIMCLDREGQGLRQKLGRQEDEPSTIKCTATRETQLEFDVGILKKKLDETGTKLVKQENMLWSFSPSRPYHSMLEMVTEGKKQAEAIGRQGITALEFHNLCLSEAETRSRVTSLEEEKALLLRGLSSSSHVTRSIASVKEATGLRRVLSHYTRQASCIEEALKKSLDVKTSMLASAEEEIKRLKLEIASQKHELAAYQNLHIDYQKLKVQADTQALQELNTWAQQSAELQAEVQVLRSHNESLALDLRHAEKALEETASASSSNKRRYSKEMQELTKAYITQEACVKRLAARGDHLEAEVKALETTRVTVVERNSLLEKSNTYLLQELSDLKAQLEEQEHQIEQSEESRKTIAQQVQDCQRLVRLVLEDVQARQHATTSSEQTDSEGTEDVTKEEQMAWWEDKERLLAEVVHLKKLQEGDANEVTKLSDQLSSASRKLQSSQRHVVNLTKEKDQLENEVNNLKAAYHKLKVECDALRWVDPERERQQLRKEMQVLQEEREILLQKLMEFEQVNVQLCAQVERLERELQMLVPTHDSDYFTQTSDYSSSQQGWSRC